MALSTISSGVQTAATAGQVGSTLVITGNGFASNEPIAITTTVGTTVVSWFTSASQNTCAGTFSSNIGGIGGTSNSETFNSLYTGSGSTACLTTTANGSFETATSVPALPGGAETITVYDGTNTVNQAFTISPKVSFSVTSGDSNFGFPEEGVPNTISVSGFGASEQVTEASPAFTSTGFTICTTSTLGSCSLTQTLTIADVSAGSKTITATGATTGLTASTTFTVNPWAAFYNAQNSITAFSFPGSAPTSLLIEAHGLTAGTIGANSITIGGVTTSNAAITVPATGAIYDVVVAPTANVGFGPVSVVLDGTTFSYAAGNIVNAQFTNGVTPGDVVTTPSGTPVTATDPWGGVLISSIAGTAAQGTGVVTSDASSYKPGLLTTYSSTSPVPQQGQIGLFGYGFVHGTAVTITSATGSTISGGLSATPSTYGAFFYVGGIADTPWSSTNSPTTAQSYSPGFAQGVNNANGPANILGPSYGITPWIDTSKSAIESGTSSPAVDALTKTGITFTSHGFGPTDVLTATVGGASLASGVQCGPAATGTCSISAGQLPDLAGGKQNVVVTGSITGASGTATGALTYYPVSTFYTTTPSTALSLVQGPSGSSTILRTSTGSNIFGVHGLLANTAYTVVWNGMGSTQALGTFTSTATGGIPVPGVQLSLPADVAGIHVIDIDASSSLGTSALFAASSGSVLPLDQALTDTADTTGLGATYTSNYGDMLFNLGTSLIATPTVANVGTSVAITGQGLATSTAYDLGVSQGGVGSGSTPTTCALTGTGPASPPTVIVGTFTSTSSGAVPSGTVLSLTDMPTVAGLEEGTLYCAFAQTGTNFGTTTAVGTAQFLLAASASDNMTSAPVGHNVVIGAHGLAASTGYNVIFAPYTNPGTSSITGTVVGAILSNSVGAGSGTFTVPSTYNTATGSTPTTSGTTYTVELQRVGSTAVALAQPPTLTVGGVSGTCTNEGTACMSVSGTPAVSKSGGNTIISATFTNNSNAPQTSYIYAVVHNALGQTVYYTTSTLNNVPAGGSGTGQLVLFGLAPGTYSATVFAVSTSGTALSTTTTVTVTI